VEFLQFLKNVIRNNSCNNDNSGSSNHSCDNAPLQTAL